MGRPKRVLSFMSQWGGNTHLQKSGPPGSASTAPSSPSAKQPTSASAAYSQSATALDHYHHERSASRDTQHMRSDSRPSSRPISMLQAYQPPVMEVGQDTLPELQRIFTFLNSHSNKLYQEGYFLKFHDTDTRGRPAPDRRWQEYFVQLVGTILSLWDASELDRANGDAEVLPTFINLTDAAIHMIPSMTLADGKKLDNILSVSTAASNKYLFHFDSYHALTQWSAGIRLAMYEHTTLQEAYTGSLIAAKGKTLNNIRIILDRQCAVYEDWVRVRFGAGTPWRRCWCVISPPDQKEYVKLQKSQKKAGVYDRAPVLLKGDMKFYDTKKVTKKTKAIATVKDAYSCYAIYPQSKPLIDQSTLVKIEGKITVHSNPESTLEGFVFVMPEARPAVTGFEIMLQFLFPLFDTFCLYGRPKKLIADVLDTRGLMFAMPSDRRYGYLEMWDVVGLISTEGSATWSERQWRKQLKDLTSLRMSSGSETDSMYSRASRRNTMSRSGPQSRGNLRFEDRASIRSNPSTRQPSPSKQSRPDLDPQDIRRSGTAPAATPFATPRHARSVSEQPQGYTKHQTASSRAPPGSGTFDDDRAPTPPVHRAFNGAPQNGFSDSDESPIHEPQDLPTLPTNLSAPPQGPMDLPPNFAHSSRQKPPVRPAMPPMMRPNPAVDNATLHQMADATNMPLPAGIAAAGAAPAWRSQDSIHSRRSGEYNSNGEHAQRPYMNTDARSLPADRHQGNRLSTIPASPYVEHPEFVDTHAAYYPTAPTVPEHGELPQASPSRELPYRSHTGGGSIQRKPVPGRSPLASQEDDNRSTTSSSLYSLRNNVIDPEALDAFNAADASIHRQPSQSSSRYTDDAASTSTPDYASVASVEVQPRRLPERREDRPRSGILKVVGDPNYKPKDGPGLDGLPLTEGTQKSTDLPDIDFGPTYALGLEAKRPGTSGTMTQKTHDTGFNKSKENLASTPTEQHRQSHISGRMTPNAATYLRSGSVSPQISDSRSMAWQPGMATAQQPERQALNAEEWVMHRASQQPQNLMYGHSRTKSKTPPPFGRAQSGDWSQMARTPEGSPGPVRPPSRPLSRPQSRGAEHLLNRPSSRGAEHLLNQHPTSLSAREQEQVARMTNTPLIDFSHNRKPVPKPTSEGLTGYIGQREKEKAAAKANHQGHSVVMQAEIDRRTQQTQQRQVMEAQQRQRQFLELQQQQINRQMAMAQSTYAPSMMGTPSVMGMSTSPATPQGMVGMAISTPSAYTPQQQQYFPQQQATPHMHIPGAWGTPTPQTPHGQYFPQQTHATQPYGASFDQAQAAARHAHQQSNYPPMRPRHDG